MLSDFQKAVVLLALACPLTMGLATIGYTRQNTAALLRTGLSSEDTALLAMLSSRIGDAGYLVTEIDCSELCDVRRLADFDLLVLADSSSLPAKSVPTIEAYLRSGGDIIALNTPMWQKSLVKIGGRWLTKEEYQIETAAIPPDNVLFDFTADDLEGWTRGSDTPEVPTIAETVEAGPAPNQHSLHVMIPNLTSYDTFGKQGLEKPFPEGHTLTVFSAKGDSATTQLAVEWDEKDGSRWIAVVPLTTEWRRYVLRPEDFKFWISVPNRGGSGDRFHPENAVGMSVGLAQSHTTAIGTGRFEYWVGPFGTAPINEEYQEILDATAPPPLDTLSPSYKLFDCMDVSKLLVRSDQAVIREEELQVPSVIRSPHPRPKGGGFSKGRDWRWIPLVEARSAKDEWRGTPVTLTAHMSGPYKGGIWASFGIGDLAWYKTPSALNMIQSIAEKMHKGIFILDAGTNFYTYFEDQDVRMGFTAANLTNEPKGNLTARISISEATGGKTVYTMEWPFSLEPNGTQTGEYVWEVPDWPPSGFICTAEILEEGRIIDKVSHEFGVWKPKPKKNFVTVKDGDFILNGRLWRPVGVNYMPSSGIGTEDGEYFEHYLSARSYDPEVFQRDIEHIKDLGMNAVSIFVYMGYEKAQNLNDLLRRLDALGLKANLALRPGTPFDFRWPGIGEIIKNARLAENDTIFAYDLAWEPTFGHQRDRVRWDRDWEKWIIERYGSIDNAEADWGFPVPRDENGNITNPTPEQVDTKGPWNRMVAAYRRFLDTLLYKKYSLARRLVRTVDPNHLVSFRMAEATNPTYRWEGRITYDFPYLAAAVDFLAPEAYGRIGTWEKVKPGWFQFEWSRWCAPMKPMVWAEQGCSVWDLGRMADSPARLEFQAEHYRAFYEMLIKSGADGLFSWWYPGGFRVGENSDFGIINPDGTDRPTTKVIREMAPKLINAPRVRPIDYWITIDRDEHPEGITGVYEKVADEFWRAIQSGRVPGLRTKGTGTTSIDCPLLAVGNTPCNGKNPPKYLDAVFDAVEIKDSQGNWIPINDGDQVKTAANKPVILRFTFTNLGEAKLVSPLNTKGKAGGVYITYSCDGSTGAKPISHDVAHLESTTEVITLQRPGSLPAEYTFSFDCRQRTPFGEKFTIVLSP